MILADKIIKLRKKQGWSQEELADKMNVSRQAVSKWESAQTIPDLTKVLHLSSLFGVTTDYLLKDDIVDEEFVDEVNDSTIRRVSIEEANTYLIERKKASWGIAIATLLCILSPITLILLCVLAEEKVIGITEDTAAMIGLATLFVFILCAVPIFIYCGFKNESFSFLDKTVPFELEYGVNGLISDKKKKFKDTYTKMNIIATCICIFSPVPLILSGFSNNDLLVVAMLIVMMILAGIGAFIFILVGVQNSSMQKLLQEGEYTLTEKRRSNLKEAVGFSYWGIAVIIFLAWSFSAQNWDVSWIVLLIAGVLFPVVLSVCNYIADKNDRT